jgi:ElaB/YqjD/DUF883 family membrane-anchored ribosome-binding protein
MRDDTSFATDELNPPTGISDAARKVSEGIGELTRALASGKQDVVEPIAAFVQERPLAAVAAAFGVGYLLGGGLFTRTTGRLIGLGWRLGGMALAKQVLRS